MAYSPAAGRYAKALFALAVERECLEPVRSDMEALRELVARSEPFTRFLDSPVVPAKQRAFLLKKLFLNKVEAITYAFLLLLEEKGRLGLLDDIARNVLALHDRHLGILRVAITSAAPLTAVQVSRIKDRLQARFDSRIEATVSVDPRLLGGFRIQAEDQILDFSLLTQLDVFKDNLLKA